MRYNIKDENGNVINTILATPEFMAANYAAGTYELAAQQDSAPAFEDPSAWFISKDKFNARFTPSESIRLELAQIHNPEASLQAQQIAAALRVVEKQKSDVQYLDLTPNSANRARIEAGLGYGKAAGVLTDARIAEMMAKPAPAERYRG
ncbi:MAG: hypothetical protein ING75_17135 [Rhodocyclaceae bacterium]|nr:hypothetical protein [Rhodocyclaceae bacterium]